MAGQGEFRAAVWDDLRVPARVREERKLVDPLACKV